MVRRSSTTLPVNGPALVEKAHLRGADALVLDPEDSLPPAEQDRARTLAKDAIPELARSSVDVLVRIAEFEARKRAALAASGEAV